MSHEPEFERYPFTVEPGSPEDGGGFFVTFPDLPGCIADGETYEEAIADARDAFAAWMAANREEGGAVPLPGQANHPVKYVQRLPHSLHKRVTRAAELDGVSMNTLVSILIAEGLGRREERQQSSVRLEEAAVRYLSFEPAMVQIGHTGNVRLPFETSASSGYSIKSVDDITAWSQGSLVAGPSTRPGSLRRRQ